MLYSDSQRAFVWQIVTLSDRTEYHELFFDVIHSVFHALLPTSLARVLCSSQRSYRSHLPEERWVERAEGRAGVYLVSSWLIHVVPYTKDDVACQAVRLGGANSKNVISWRQRQWSSTVTARNRRWGSTLPEVAVDGTASSTVRAGAHACATPR